MDRLERLSWPFVRSKDDGRMVGVQKKVAQHLLVQSKEWVENVLVLEYYIYSKRT